MKSIKELKNIKGKAVLLRVDFNVPIKNSRVFDDFRIIKSLPTINLLRKKGAKVILISHMGADGSQSLLPVAKHIDKKFFKCAFMPSIIDSEVKQAVDTMNTGEVLLLENLRSNAGEMKNSVSFAKELASLADIYVDDAFSAAHRAHASIIGVPKYLPSYAGLQMTLEVKHLSKVLKNPKSPFLFVLGGAKFETKMPLIEKYLRIADVVFITGALANNFFKAEGHEIGRSVVDSGKFGIEKILKNKKLILPIDVIAENLERESSVKNFTEIKKSDKIVDIGPETVKFLSKYITQTKTVLWNGPTGYYEGGYIKATKQLLTAVAKSKTFSVIGGGDTVSLIMKFKMENKFSFVSTGGGATLDFLIQGTLPGIKALK
ncbi:MAG: phosphoglycerate kinase [Candidatus Paceibacterota bacterium]|jgi:3-phosphoglycerate kinase